MKRTFLVGLVAILALGFILSGCSDAIESAVDVGSMRNAGLEMGTPVPPITAEDREASVGILPFDVKDLEPFLDLSIPEVAEKYALYASGESARRNASGLKIPSNAHSDHFPGIIFEWETNGQGQSTVGFLKVNPDVFEKYENGFILTAKQANAYLDYWIQPFVDAFFEGYYVFEIPTIHNLVRSGKKINMVFIDEVFIKEITPIITYRPYPNAVEGKNKKSNETAWGGTVGATGPNVVLHEDNKGWAMSIKIAETAVDPVVVDLVFAQNFAMGKAIVENAGDKILLTYQFYAEAVGEDFDYWYIPISDTAKFSFHAQVFAQAKPLDEKGKNMGNGQFNGGGDFIGSDAPGLLKSFTFELSKPAAPDADGFYYVAAHCGGIK